MEPSLRCPRCGNTDPSWFAHGAKGWYCRRCISFGRALLEEEEQAVSIQPVDEEAYEYALSFPLTPVQKEISQKAAETVRSEDVLLKCVCGAGKTEMCVPAISEALKEGKKVCFAIARRQVVLEVGERLAGYFSHADTAVICGGHTEKLDGDLIVCTTHQLYRFTGCFDLLILDEPDAFPFHGDPVLHGIAKNSCHGHVLYLTATPDEILSRWLEEGSLVCYELNERPHHHPLPVPRIHTGPLWLLLILLVRWLKEYQTKPRMVFVPTIRKAKRLHRLLRRMEPCHLCTSKTENRDEEIEAFRSEKHGLIVATTVLERGVTVKHAQVCVFEAENGVFDEAGLVQMAGRAGRAFDDPEGDVLFLCLEKSALAYRCQKSLKEANDAVSSLR
jgi:competence protein ComFA